MACCNNCLGKTLPCELETGPPTALYVHRPDASPPPIPQRSASGFAPLPTAGYIEPEEDAPDPGKKTLGDYWGAQVVAAGIAAYLILLVYLGASALGAFK